MGKNYAAAGLRRRWAYPQGLLQLCGFATQVRWVRGAGWHSGFAAKPVQLAS